MSQAYSLFSKHAENTTTGLLKDRQLTMAGFKRLWLELVHPDLEDCCDVPREVLKEAFRHAKAKEPERHKRLDFNQFCIWFSSCYFLEDVALDTESRTVRRLARKHAIHHAEVERYKDMFHKFDEDNSGTIDRDEFEKLLCKCTKVPDSIGLPTTRVKNLWRTADVDGDHSVTFEEFLTFHNRYLASGSTGFEDFYRFGGSTAVAR